MITDCCRQLLKTIQTWIGPDWSNISADSTNKLLLSYLCTIVRTFIFFIEVKCTYCRGSPLSTISLNTVLGIVWIQNRTIRGPPYQFTTKNELFFAWLKLNTFHVLSESNFCSPFSTNVKKNPRYNLLLRFIFFRKSGQFCVWAGLQKRAALTKSK